MESIVPLRCSMCVAKIRLPISNSSKLLAIAIKTIFESNFFLKKHYIPDVDRGRDGLEEYCRILCIFSAIILDYTVCSSKWHCIIIVYVSPTIKVLLWKGESWRQHDYILSGWLCFGFILDKSCRRIIFQEPFMITYMLLVVASYRTIHAHVYMCSASVFLLWSEYVRFWYEPGFISLRMRGNAKRDEDVSNSNEVFSPFFQKTFICPSYFHLAYVTIRTRQIYIYVKWQEDRTSTTVHQIRFHFFHSF